LTTPRITSGGDSSMQFEENSPKLLTLKDGSAWGEANNYKVQGDALLGTDKSVSKSTNLDSVGEVTDKSSPEFDSPSFSPEAKKEHALALPNSWTYPVAKHANPTDGRDGMPYWHGNRLHGNSSTRLASAARRRWEQEQEPQTPRSASQDTSERIAAAKRPASRCFEDLYADAVERHRRFKTRVSRFLEKEDARIAVEVGRAHKEYMRNQRRFSGTQEPDSPSPGSFRRELRKIEVEEEQLKRAQKEADRCTFHPNTNSTPTTPKQVKRSRSATPNADRAHNYGSETARRSKSVGWIGGTGARSVDHKDLVATTSTPSGATPSGTTPGVPDGIFQGRLGQSSEFEVPTSAKVQPPMSTVGIDSNFDGRTDYYLRGIDMNRDGIPDILQQGNMATVNVDANYVQTPDIQRHIQDSDGGNMIVTGVDRNRDGIPDMLQNPSYVAQTMRLSSGSSAMRQLSDPRQATPPGSMRQLSSLSPSRQATPPGPYAPSRQLSSASQGMSTIPMRQLSSPR